MSSNSIYQPTWLYIKQHNQTGLKYFGKHIGKDPYKYRGSGLRWNNHLNVHGNDVTTIWCKLFDSESELKAYALEFSLTHNIVESSEWANLIPENGNCGGSSKGTPKTEEHKLKIGKANAMHVRTPEQKEHLSVLNIGKKMSAETLAKRKATTAAKMATGYKRPNSQKDPWNKGIKMSVEQRKNMGAPKGGVPWNKGASTPLKGKTYEEIYGPEKAAELRQSRRESQRRTEAKKRLNNH